MRILTHGVAALLAFLLGLGGGYVFWGVPGAAVARQLQQQRADYEYRLAEQAQRLKAAEERARLEAEMRKVLEEEVHRLSPRS
jgi:cell division protein FtsB